MKIDLSRESGERMQPTAQALGQIVSEEQAPKGRKKVTAKESLPRKPPQAPDHRTQSRACGSINERLSADQSPEPFSKTLSGPFDGFPKMHNNAEKFAPFFAGVKVT
jgi:hypothetical protein